MLYSSVRRGETLNQGCGKGQAVMALPRRNHCVRWASSGMIMSGTDEANKTGQTGMHGPLSSAQSGDH
jgi:hypothetical protein